MRVGTSFLCNFAVFYLLLSPLETVALTPCCFYCHTHCTQYKFLSKRVKVKSFLVKSNILAFMRISLLCTHAVSSYFFFVQESPVLPVFLSFTFPSSPELKFEQTLNKKKSHKDPFSSRTLLVSVRVCIF